MIRLGPLLLLLACSIEGQVGADPRGVDDDGDGWSERDGDCNDSNAAVAPELPERCDGLDNDCDGEIDGEACARLDEFGSVPRLDLLIVIDDSESMREERLRLGAGLADLVPHVIQPDHDVHVGVITSNPADPAGMGVLHQVDGRRWLDGQLDGQEAMDWLAAAVDTNAGGAGPEQVRAAAFAAVELEGQARNAGFRRETADLAILIASDEDDGSAAPTLDDFLAWLDGEPGLDRSTVHGIVSTEFADPCGSGGWGQEHLELVALTGGTYLSVCEADYGPFLAGLGQAVVQDALPRRFALADPAVPESLSLEVRLDNGLTDVLGPERFVYDAAVQEVVIVDDQPPPAGSTVRVSYLAVPEGW